MTHPPSDPTPAIPGAAAWHGAATAQPPSFTSPAPVAPLGGSQQFELASWGSRFGATLIDVLLRLLIAGVITTAIWTLVADHPFSWGGSEAFDQLDESGSGIYDFSDFNAVWFVMSVIVMYWLTGLLYGPITMTMWRGATPGKRVTGVRVVTADGRDLSFGHSFLREPIIKGFVIAWLGAIVFFVPVLNYLWPLWDSECRAGHDYMARTRVVRA